MPRKKLDTLDPRRESQLGLAPSLRFWMIPDGPDTSRLKPHQPQARQGWILQVISSIRGNCNLQRDEWWTWESKSPCTSINALDCSSLSPCGLSATSVWPRTDIIHLYGDLPSYHPSRASFGTSVELTILKTKS